MPSRFSRRLKHFTEISGTKSRKPKSKYQKWIRKDVPVLRVSETGALLEAILSRNDSKNSVVLKTDSCIGNAMKNSKGLILIAFTPSRRERQSDRKKIEDFLRVWGLLSEKRLSEKIEKDFGGVLLIQRDTH